MTIGLPGTSSETEMGQAGDISDTAMEKWRARLRPILAKELRVEPRRCETRTDRPRTVREAADELGLSVHTVRAWIASRRLGHLRLGRAIRIPAAEIRRVLEESNVPALREE